MNPTIYFLKIHHDKMGFIPRLKHWFNTVEPINVTDHIKRF